MNSSDFVNMSLYFNIRADEMNDAADHDEMHAASDVCTILTYMPELTSPYIERWLLELSKR